MEYTERRDVRQKIVDELIRCTAGGAVLTSGILVPGVIIGLHKPLEALLNKLDERERARELRKAVYRMKERGLLAGDYEHGLVVTDKARKRLLKRDIESLCMTPQPVWDGKWRIIIYDIPEKHTSARHALQARLLRYGCMMLQKSTWITPFPCRNDIVTLGEHHAVSQFITYFEVVSLDNYLPLLRRFKRRYPDTTFPTPISRTIE